MTASPVADQKLEFSNQSMMVRDDIKFCSAPDALKFIRVELLHVLPPLSSEKCWRRFLVGQHFPLNMSAVDDKKRLYFAVCNKDNTTAQQLIAKGVWSLQASNVALVMNDMELYGAIKANYPTNVVINDAGKSSDTVE